MRDTPQTCHYQRCCPWDGPVQIKCGRQVPTQMLMHCVMLRMCMVAGNARWYARTHTVHRACVHVWLLLTYMGVPGRGAACSARPAPTSGSPKPHWMCTELWVGAARGRRHGIVPGCSCPCAFLGTLARRRYGRMRIMPTSIGARPQSWTGQRHITHLGNLSVYSGSECTARPPFGPEVRDDPYLQVMLKSEGRACGRVCGQAV
jgi:hypothetical protein